MATQVNATNPAAHAGRRVLSSSRRLPVIRDSLIAAAGRDQASVKDYFAWAIIGRLAPNAPEPEALDDGSKPRTSQQSLWLNRGLVQIRMVPRLDHPVILDHWVIPIERKAL
jgi:hypothetical protein